MLKTKVTTNNFSGVLLVARSERIILHNCYGFVNIKHRVANGPGTVFQLASVSNPFEAAAIMLLHEQGKVDLKAALTDILPDYPDGKEANRAPPAEP